MTQSSSARRARTGTQANVQQVSKAVQGRMRRYEELRLKGISKTHAARAAGWPESMIRKLPRLYPDWYAQVEAEVLHVAQGGGVPASEQVIEVDLGGPKPEVPSFPEFRAQAFGVETPRHMAEIAHHLIDCGCKRLLVLVPPEHAKTTLVCRDFIAYLLAKEALAVSRGEKFVPVRAAVISQTSTYAQTVGWQLRQALEDKDLYPWLHQWGPFDEGSSWTARAIYMQWRDAQEKEPSVQWLGYKNQIQGARLTHAILDDVDSPTVGEADRNKLVTTFDHTIGRRLGKTGKGVIIGTRVAEDDFYKLIKTKAAFPNSPWHVVELQAVDEYGEPLWPEMFDAAYFEGVRAEMANDRLFNLVYQQIESPGTSAVFDVEAAEASKNHDLGLRTPLDGALTIVGIDPSEEGPYAAVAWSFEPKERRIRLLDVLAEPKGGPERMKAAVGWACGELRAHRLAIEKAGGLSLFLDDEMKRVIRDFGTRLSMVPTSGQGIVDRDYGIEAMATWLRQGRIEFPWNPQARHVVGPLLDEWLGYHHQMIRPKDRLMASWFGFRLCLESVKGAAIVSFGPASQQAPWVRAHQRTVPLRRRDDA